MKTNVAIPVWVLGLLASMASAGFEAGATKDVNVPAAGSGSQGAAALQPAWFAAPRPEFGSDVLGDLFTPHGTSDSASGFAAGTEPASLDTGLLGDPSESSDWIYQQAGEDMGQSAGFDDSPWDYPQDAIAPEDGGERPDGSIPAPGAALLGTVGLGTVGLGIFVWFRRRPP